MSVPGRTVDRRPPTADPRSGPVKLLFLGFDGADPRTVERLASTGRLPALSSLARRGVLRPIRSTRPAATFPAWATCLTGAGPGRHGVFDFARVDGYTVRFGARRPAVPTFLESTAAHGLRVGAVGFPGRFAEGGMAFRVAGWDAPLETAAGARHVHPPGLQRRIVERFGGRALRFAAADECRPGGRGWRGALAASLGESIRVRTDLVLWLVSEIPVDVLAVHYQAADTAGHHLIGTAHLDRTYELLDEAAGMLIESLAPGTVIVVSDHGMGPTAGIVVSLNALLARGGFLRWRRGSIAAAGARLLRRIGLYGLPAALRGPLFRAAGGFAPGLVESGGRYAPIDMPRTAAFSDELTYAPSVRLNVRGREPLGIVAPEDRRRVAGEIVAYMRGIEHPRGGALFAEALLREEVYQGPFTHEAPDVVLEFAEDARGRTPALCPPHLRPDLGDRWWMPVPPGERAGRKGGVLRGSHRPFGMFLAARAPAGLEGRADLSLEDVAPLACAALGVEAPAAAAAGAPVRRPSSPSSVVGGAPPRLRSGFAARAAMTDEAWTEAERAALIARLEALGYIEGP